MQCKNGAKGINLCCKSWPKENLFTDFCPRPLMKICQKTINHTLRTQCQGKDIDIYSKGFLSSSKTKKKHNLLDPDNLKKSSHRDLFNEGPSFILRLLEVGHWATNKWSFYDNSQILTALLANFLTLFWQILSILNTYIPLILFQIPSCQQILNYHRTNAKSILFW